MCGITGIVSLDGAGVDAATLAAMNETLVHRGPDSSGSFVDGPAGLAMRRLSIIDLSHGDQPIFNENGQICVIQNGEIYNYAELRRDLQRRGHEFKTDSDTEVLVHLYEERGLDFVEDLRGMFAIAIWDRRTATLVLARDRFGIKPLYYRVAGGELSFASELKALMRQPGCSRSVSLDAFEALLAFNCIPAPLTIFEQVQKLPAGHTLTCSGGAIELHRYARPEPVPSAQTRSASRGALAAELLDRLRDSVRAHLVADVPVGVLLSGGVDSSTLAALAAQESGGARVSTFSIGFEERAFNELDRARLVAQRYGTDHHELIVAPDAVELFPKLIDAFDEPFADSSALPSYLVSELAAKTVKVAMSGEGGDELFGGYYTYVANQIAPVAGPIASRLAPLIERLPSRGGRGLDSRLKRFARGAHLPPDERHYAWKQIFSPEMRDALVESDRRGQADPIETYRERYAETDGAEPLARLQDIDMGVYLVDDLLVKTDRASMAHSLEVRVPFLDTVVTDFALALPAHLKVRGTSRKRLLRQAVAPLLPREITHGRKQGFSIPAATWLRGELSGFTRDVLSPDALRRQGFFSPQAVERLIDDHVSGRHDLSPQLWCLLSFTLWNDRYGATAVA